MQHEPKISEHRYDFIPISVNKEYMVRGNDYSPNIAQHIILQSNLTQQTSRAEVLQVDLAM